MAPQPPESPTARSGTGLPPRNPRPGDPDFGTGPRYHEVGALQRMVDEDRIRDRFAGPEGEETIVRAAARDGVEIDRLDAVLMGVARQPRDYYDGELVEVEVAADALGTRPGDRWLAIVERTGKLVEVLAVDRGTFALAAENGMGC